MIGKYTLISGVSLVVDYGSFLALAKVGGVDYTVAASVGYLVGLLVHYLLSRRFVFGAGMLSERPMGEFFAYLLTGLVGLATTAGVVAIFELAKVDNVHVIKGTAVAVSFVIVYLLRKHLLFGKAVMSIWVRRLALRV